MAANSSSLCFFRMTTHSLIQKIMTSTQQLRILGLGRTPGALGCPSRVTKESITGGSGKQRCHGPRPPPRPGASPSSDRQDLSLPRRESTEALKHLNPSGGRWVHALLQWHCGGVLPVQLWPSQWWSDLKVIEAWEDVTMWYHADCQFEFFHVFSWSTFSIPYPYILKMTRPSPPSCYTGMISLRPTSSSPALANQQPKGPDLPQQ